VEGAASSPPVRDGGQKKSSSRGPPLPFARKSKPREESRASETSAASPGRVAHGDGSSLSRTVTLEPMARDSGDTSSSEASFRGRSRDSSASSSRAAGTKSGAEDSSSDEEDDSGSEEEDSNSEADQQRLEKAQKKVSVKLAGLIKARKEMKDAAKEIEQELQAQMVKKKEKYELKKVAVERVEEEAANRRAAEAAAAEEAEVSKRELEADRQREQQREQREEEQREQREEERRRERETRKRSEDDRGTRKRSEDDRVARKRPEAGRVETGERETSWEGRHVRDRRVQDRLGKREEERPGRSSGPEGAGLEPDYTIPRKGRPWKKTTTHSRSLPQSYEGYTIALPRSEKEKLVFQQLLDRRMLFRAPGAGPDRCRELHFRFRAGEPILGSERADRRRSRSPGGQEAARKRRRNLKH
jgi:hypothetical protein